ncbi:MAG: TatD family hydrolase [Clostridiales bacterium]|nr:TatD family hydrolase [Clostridiales bacterium]
MLFDSHAHVNDEKYKDDQHEMIMRAYESGVKLIMLPSTSIETSLSAIEVSNKYDFIYSAVGIHPHDTKNMNEITLEKIKKLLENPKVKALGEIGLDYYYDFSPRDIQKKWFEEQLNLAKEFNLPVIIHDRDAHKDVMDILTKVDAFKTGVVMHCFSGSKELALEYVKKGAYISFAGPVTFKNARKAKEAAAIVPLDRVLIETDSPYLSPEPFRGKRNEPEKVRFVAMTIAGIREITFAEVAEITYNNAKRIFKIE